MGKEITLEEAKAEITALNAQRNKAVTDLENSQAEILALKEQMKHLLDAPVQLQTALIENETLKSENAELKLLAEKGAKVAKAIPGTYKSKLHKKEIRFKDGMLKTAIDGKLVDSAEVIKNEGGKYTKVLDFFIEVGASVIEIVD
jgi:chromosome segregation ATPase